MGLVLEMVVKFFGTPLGRWIAIAAMVAAALFAGAVHERSVGERNNQEKNDQQRQAEEAAAARLAAWRSGEFARISSEHAAETARLEEQLKTERAKHQRDLEIQKRSAPAYVSEISTRDTCPVLPVGYLLYRRNAADLANGLPPSAPEPSAELARAASGISLSTLAGVDSDQADAFASCTERLRGWEKYYGDLEVWKRNVDQILLAAPP